MNKKRMGQFLRKLRNDKDWSQEEVSNKFRENYFDVSIKAISDWENGKTIPEIDKLSILANLYSVSIDEILDGEASANVDYFAEYVFADKNWYSKFTDKDDIYTIHQEQKLRVCKRFKQLLIKVIEGNDTKNERLEFKFLFEHFYKLSACAEEYITTTLNDDFLKLDEAIRNRLTGIGELKSDEKYFEISKFIIPTDESNVRLNEIVDGVNPNSYIDKRFKALDWWEKDMLLMSIQKGDFVFDESKFGANTLKMYEERFGREFDKEKCVRKAVKYMIDNGACLNYQFINLISRKQEKRRIIDKVEELYLLCEKPLPCSYMDGEKTFTRYAENNGKNRFIANYYYHFKFNFEFMKLSFDELYDFLWKYDPENMSNELIVCLAKRLNIDTERDMKYIRADLNMHSYLFESWKEYRLKEKKIEEGFLELRKLENKLENGEVYELTTIEEYIGGKDFNTLMDYFEYWKTLVSLQELRGMRDKAKTKELLDHLSSYSLEDIRNIYFKEEVIENETN